MKTFDQFQDAEDRNELQCICSDVWLAQREKRARARRNANLKKALLVILWAICMGFGVVAFMRWWVTLP